MRYSFLLSILMFVACNSNERADTATAVESTANNPDTVQVTKEPEPEPPVLKTYSNDRFRDVTVERIGQDSFVVRGQGQIFEANFGWVVEDGHHQLKDSFHMTDAGAPDWGNFEFGFEVQKVRKNSTLMLILFESSAKDGSRQHELPIALY